MIGLIKVKVCIEENEKDIIKRVILLFNYLYPPTKTFFFKRKSVFNWC